MDPITSTHLVQDRTAALQRTADQVRQERALHSTPSATPPAAVDSVAVTVTQTRVADPPPAPAASAKATDCAAAERAA